MKFGRVVFRDMRADKQTDRQTERHTDTLITILRIPTLGEVMIYHNSLMVVMLIAVE